MNSKLIAKYWLDIFIYLSLILLIYYLLEADILFFPRLYSASSLFLSVILLIAGFLSEMYAWYYLLKEYGIKPRPITIFIGSGTAILGKYIPGKVWTVLGRAKVVAGEVNKGVTEISFISFESQIIFIWAGLFISLIGSLLGGIKTEYMVIVLVAWLILTIIIFSDRYKGVVEKLITKIFRKEFVIPKITYKKGKVILVHALPWVIWSTGFYFVSLAILPYAPSFLISFAFVISATFGIIALFSPGGLGVREGIITGYMVMSGIDLPAAVTISLFSRLWFLAGELVIFLTGVTLYRTGKKNG